MKNCSYKKYFQDYINGELTQKDIIDFQSHLETCTTCPTDLEEFYQFHYKIKRLKRPEPDPELIADYRQNLSVKFSDYNRNTPWSNNVLNLYQSIFGDRSWGVKFAEVLGLLLIGVVIGWFLFNNQTELNTYQNNNIEYYPKPISKAEVEYINYYFQAAELLLLEMKNIDSQSRLNKDEIEFNKSIAQKLLIKTFIIHEIALRQKDSNILRFLSKMELLLYEVSNTPTEELEKSIDSFIMIIDDSRLIADARKFQKEFIRFEVSPQQKDFNSNN